ncbi:hypothetical protein HDV00_007592 [Rhizophlyctis rosea]|nr:hypothetical protein HDV00_007592 [Rhizophlyctis rosea]
MDVNGKKDILTPLTADPTTPPQPNKPRRPSHIPQTPTYSTSPSSTTTFPPSSPTRASLFTPTPAPRRTRARRSSLSLTPRTETDTLLTLYQTIEELQKELTQTRTALRESRRRNEALETEVEEVRGALVEWIERCGELERERRRSKRLSGPGIINGLRLDPNVSDPTSDAPPPPTTLTSPLTSSPTPTSSPPSSPTTSTPTLQTQLQTTQTQITTLRASLSTLTTLHTTLESHHADLQSAYAQQTKHVEELERLIEEERARHAGDGVHHQGGLVGGGGGGGGVRTPVGSVKGGKGKRRISLLSPAVHRRSGGGGGLTVGVSNPFLDTVRDLRNADLSGGGGEGGGWEGRESIGISSTPASKGSLQSELAGLTALTLSSTKKGGLIYDRILGVRKEVQGVAFTPLKTPSVARGSHDDTPARQVNSAINPSTPVSTTKPPRTPHGDLSARKSLLDMLTSTWHEREVSSGENSKEASPMRPPVLDVGVQDEGGRDVTVAEDGVDTVDESANGVSSPSPPTRKRGLSTPSRSFQMLQEKHQQQKEQQTPSPSRSGLRLLASPSSRSRLRFDDSEDEEVDGDVEMGEFEGSDGGDMEDEQEEEEEVVPVVRKVRNGVGKGRVRQVGGGGWIVR